VKLLYVSCVTFGSGKIHGLRPDYSHRKLEYPNCRTLPVNRRIRPEENEKVSPARNNHDKRPCATLHSDTDMDDMVPFGFS
jgi:hypothetical protein